MDLRIAIILLEVLQVVQTSAQDVGDLSPEDRNLTTKPTPLKNTLARSIVLAILAILCEYYIP